MKIFLLKRLILLVFIFNFSIGLSQESKLKLKQNPKIDSLLKKKIYYDKERFENSYFTLQLYYGNLDFATEILNKSKEIFPHIPVEINFETPNYKVQAGYYKDKLIGIKTLDTVKKVFPSAFLLLKKDL
tara:strand:+ start:131 stop:517 length:387 start_codon:yes stop_codon:yes gene_type:complete